MSEKDRLLHDIFILLDHLQRQGDSRLQAHFDDTRPHITTATAGMVATPPCKSYREFLTRLSQLKDGRSALPQPGETSPLDDAPFLRWSKDFLAAVAAPATIETISITREYIRTRAERASMSWREWWRSFATPPAAPPADRFRDTAHWIARILIRLERLTVIVAIATVLLSAYAMVGRMIIDHEQDALEKFEQLVKSADDDHAAMLRSAGAQLQFADGQSRTELLSISGGQLYLRFDQIDHSCPVHLEPGNSSDDGKPIATVAALSGPDFDAAGTAWNLVAKCRGVQWALMQLVTENVRLKSWDTPFVEFPPTKWLIGWDNKMIDKVGDAASNEFCQSVASAYSERFEKSEPPQGCKELINLLVRDSGSLASSILACITMSILPCLYAFIGAAAATMLRIRRRADAALLSYTDRGLATLNVILGIVFGAVIGLFTGYFSSSANTAGNGLGLSALALLAGYNVPAVSEFLNDLSNRLFRPQPQNAAGSAGN